MMKLNSPRFNLPKVPPRLRWTRRYLGIDNLLQSSMHIHFLGSPSPGITPEECSVSKIEHQEGRDTNISRKKVTDRPFRGPKHGKSIDERHERCARHTEISTVWLDPRLVWLLDALSLHCLAESEEYNAAADPGDEA